MCIRDSGYTEADWDEVSAVPDTRPEDLAAAKPFAEVFPEPVSYTHLRAHETVLDLVCRLLLEKKNQTRRQMYATARDQQTHKQDDQLRADQSD